MNRQRLKDALENTNVRAFLMAIRLGEGTIDDAGYWRIVGGGTFNDDRVHPNIRVFIPRYNVWSSAAGAYQIIGRTWRAVRAQYGFEDFTPDCQDEAAVALILGRGALDDVEAGRLGDAISKCAAEWASLPGSTAGQRTESFARVAQVYQDHGGSLA